MLLAAPPHPSPARAQGVTQLAPPPPPAPGRQRARAQSPPGRRRSGLRALWIAREARTVEMGPEMRLTRICCCCCLLYQLGFLSHGTISGTF